MAATGYLSTIRGLNRDTRLIIVSWALSSCGTLGIDSVLGNLYILRLGYDTEYLGVLNAIILLAMGLASVPASELGRRWGYRRAMVLGLTMGSAGLGLVPAAMLLPDSARGVWLIAAYPIAYVGSSPAPSTRPPI